MQGIMNLHHDSFFFLILILVFVLRLVLVVYFHFHPNPMLQRIVHLIPMELVVSGLYYFLNIDLSCLIDVVWCDAGIGSPSGIGDLQPVVQPQVNAEVLPPEVPEPPVPNIPVLEQPLIPDSVRAAALYRRLTVMFFGQFDRVSLTTIVGLVDRQVLIEKLIEAALVHDGYHPARVASELNRIRGFLFYPQGTALSVATLSHYIRQIEQNGTRESTPYRRIFRAILNYEAFLE
jgi:hypothetical protein